MKPNLWSTMSTPPGRRAIDRALLASLEREIANEEKLRARSRLPGSTSPK